MKPSIQHIINGVNPFVSSEFINSFGRGQFDTTTVKIGSERFNQSHGIPTMNHFRGQNQVLDPQPFSSGGHFFLAYGI